MRLAGHFRPVPDMSTLALSMPASGRARLTLAGEAALLGMVAALQLSIAVAQSLLAIALLCSLISRGLRRERLEAPSFFWPLVAYAALTLVAAGFSRDAARSLADCRQLALFLIVPVVYDLARGDRARTLLSVVITVGAASALIGIVQYGILNYDNLGRRTQGALSHWMTYSGMLMLVICATVARLLYDDRDRAWAAMVTPALFVGLGLTFTRGAWIGAAGGLAALLLGKDRRLVPLVPLLAALAIAVGPSSLTNRAYSILDMNDLTSRDRLAMLQAGAAIVQAHPLTGVGPDMIERVYPTYRVPWAVQPSNPHLHNVPMQIAAERGLPALAVWAWFIVVLLRGLRRVLEERVFQALAAAGVASVMAMLTAGLFEYNFGDSEFLMLFLVLVTLPFAASRRDAA